MYTKGLKRILDIILSGVSLVVLSPLLILATLAIYLEDGGPVLFRQTRVGRDGMPFQIFKLRSMSVGTLNIPSSSLGPAARITRVGAVIRRTNIDELPQLFNILRGEMSLVGPRPALPGQSELTNLRRLNGSLASVPGLTGLAQINSYDGMSDSNKAEWDGRYARQTTFKRDLGIVLRTCRYLLKRPPVY